MKRILFLLLCVLPQFAIAQTDVATYNKDRHQLINYHTNSDGEIEKGRQAYKKMYAGFWQDVAVNITEKDGEEVVTYTLIDKDGRSAEARNAPANGESNKVMDVVRQYTERTKYGILDYINISYYTPSSGEEKWSYSKTNGKMTLSSHNVFVGEGKRDYPYYRVWLDYSN